VGITHVIPVLLAEFETRCASLNSCAIDENVNLLSMTCGVERVESPSKQGFNLAH
jgi:hypothetical protein